MAGEVAELFDIGKSGRYGDVDATFLHRNERDGFVCWTFHEQLDLSVLIGGAEGGHWRRPDRSAVRSFLAQAFRPQLHEPSGEIAQWIGVRHEYGDGLFQLGIGEPL